VSWKQFWPGKGKVRWWKEKTTDKRTEEVEEVKEK